MKTYSYLLNSQLRSLVLIAMGLCIGTASLNAGVGRIAISGIDEALEVAAKLSGRGLSETGERVARESLERALARHGESALEATRRGGVELFEASSRHGSELLSWAAQHPRAARSLALKADELVPHIRRYGDDILKIELRQPGTAPIVAQLFGREGVETFARTNIPQGDYYRLLGLGRKADSPATAQKLLQAYRSEGTHFLDRLKPGQILAGGLSVAMITAAWNTSDGMGDAMRETPAILPLTVAPVALAVFGVSGAVVLGLILLAYIKWSGLKKLAPND